MLSVAAAHFLGIFCEALFYGIYLGTCYFCIHPLFMKGDKNEEQWRDPHDIHWVMVLVFLALFIICTFDVSIGLVHIFRAFIQSHHPEQELLNSSNWINLVRSVTQGAILIVGDFLLIYRCWVVYGYRWLVIVPSTVLFVGGTVSLSCKLIAVYASLHTHPEGITLGIPINNLTVPWWTALFSITVVQNILSSGILIWRIWRVERELEKQFEGNAGSDQPPRYLRRIIRVIAESGAAYAAILVACAFLLSWKDNGAYLIANIALQSGGIVFNVIIARCSPQRERQFVTYDCTERSTLRFAQTRESALYEP
ncbi:hypothetical protein D9756_010924 [Leucocoprinus leucothites]|uniref:Uncharacterized protein n=1 Tax=Leucocoprinus leucothites TaxID=201217 RepID=A0A8H5CQW8_9AGAR|nr:hypothetical protein D9756_010924 [Leucoagaricus leucothites]